MVSTVIWFWQPLRSVAVMSVYSAIHEKDSIMAEKGFEIDIPGGLTTKERDWYPFVMTFNSGGYNARGGLIDSMTIMYNFPSFNPLTRTNAFYEPDSPYNSSFYGAYVIRSSGGIPYCYGEDGSPDYSEVMHAFKYDYINLVLDSLGDNDFEFVVQQFTGDETDYLGYSGWTMINAVINTNSVTHVFEKPKRSYIQYGRPIDSSNDNFDVIKMHGRLYMRYFPEYDSTIIFYIMSPDRAIINKCDENILSKSEISLR
jgi:hypothetical protein